MLDDSLPAPLKRFSDLAESEIFDESVSMVVLISRIIKRQFEN